MPLRSVLIPLMRVCAGSIVLMAGAAALHSAFAETYVQRQSDGVQWRGFQQLGPVSWWRVSCSDVVWPEISLFGSDRFERDGPFAVFHPGMGSFELATQFPEEACK